MTEYTLQGHVILKLSIKIVLRVIRVTVSGDFGNNPSLLKELLCFLKDLSIYLHIYLSII